MPSNCRASAGSGGKQRRLPDQERLAVQAGARKVCQGSQGRWLAAARRRGKLKGARPRSVGADHRRDQRDVRAINKIGRVVAWIGIGRQLETPPPSFTSRSKVYLASPAQRLTVKLQLRGRTLAVQRKRDRNRGRRSAVPLDFKRHFQFGLVATWSAKQFLDGNGGVV